MAQPVRILRADDVRAALDMAACIDAVRARVRGVLERRRRAARPSSTSTSRSRAARSTSKPATSTARRTTRSRSRAASTRTRPARDRRHGDRLRRTRRRAGRVPARRRLSSPTCGPARPAESRPVTLRPVERPWSPSSGPARRRANSSLPSRCVRPELAEVRVWGRDDAERRRGAPTTSQAALGPGSGSRPSPTSAAAVDGRRRRHHLHRLAGAAGVRRHARPGRPRHRRRVRRRRQAGARPGDPATRRPLVVDSRVAVRRARRAAARRRPGRPGRRARRRLRGRAPGPHRATSS